MNARKLRRTRRGWNAATTSRAVRRTERCTSWIHPLRAARHSHESTAAGRHEVGGEAPHIACRHYQRIRGAAGPEEAARSEAQSRACLVGESPWARRLDAQQPQQGRKLGREGVRGQPPSSRAASACTPL